MKKERRFDKTTTVAAFTVAFIFFQFAYPYHLMRREQLDLFLYDGDYISQTYRGAGWLSRFVEDFFNQFLYFQVLGPFLFALMLTAIGVLTYKISRHFLNKGFSFAIATLVFAWSFLRETGNIELTRYSLAVLCYLAVIYGLVQFKKLWQKALYIPFIAFAIWAVGSPFHADYGKLFNTPSLRYDRFIGMEVELVRENWSKVRKLAEKDYHVPQESYAYNLACAMEGDLSENFFKYSQFISKNSLFLPISGQETEFTNYLSGEVWYHLGDMNQAERSSIISMECSPEHTGTKYLRRLATINLISGEEEAAKKYLSLLSKTLVYGRWARKMLEGNYDEETTAWLENSKAKLPLKENQFVYNTTDMRPVLLGLLDADSDNGMARDYLLCYDLMRGDLESFMEDYSPEKSSSDIYQEAVLIWLNQHGISEDEAFKYGVSKQNVDRLDKFFKLPNNYKGTYWYYYMYLLVMR